MKALMAAASCRGEEIIVRWWPGAMDGQAARGA